MKYIKYIIPSLFLIALPVLAAPTSSFMRTLLPETTNTYDLGSASKIWNNLYTNQICLSADCKTAWPTGGTGGSGGGTFATSTAFGTTLLNYPLNATDVVMIGSTGATSTAPFWFNPNTQNALIKYASSTGITSTYGFLTNLVINGQTFTNLLGTGLTNSGGVLTNSAPDQTVVLSNGTGISTSGTYPNFTITNTAPLTFTYPFPSAATSTVLTFSNPPIFSSLTGILKGNGASAIGTASNGTDYTLVSAQTCGAGQHISALTASGGSTCSADTGSGGTGNVGTSSVPVLGGLAYWTTTTATPALLSTVSTTTLTGTAPIVFSIPISVIGDSASIISLANTAVTPGTYTNTTLTVDAQGRITNASTGTAGATTPLSVETPSGTKNGTNKDFTVANTPSFVTVDGQTMSLNDDYTYSAPTISFINAPSSTAVIRSYFGGGVSNLSLNGQTGSTQTFATTSNAGGWGITSATNVHTLNIPTQDGSQPLGLLSSANWTTFNNKQATITATWPHILTGTTLTFGGLSTTTALTTGRLAMVSGVNTFADVATTTLTASAPLSLDQPVVKVGGSNSILTCTTASSGVGGCLGSTAFDTFNNKQATISVNWPITLTGATLGFGWTYPFPSAATTTVLDLTNSFKTSGLSQGFGYIGSGGLFNTMSSSTIKTSWLTNDSGFTNFTYPFPSAATSTLLTLSGGLTISGGTTDLSASTVKTHTYATFAYATSTAFTGTTTIALGVAFNAEAWNQIKCYTDTGTVNISVNDGTNRMNMLNASTTIGTFTFSTNNTFTASEKRYIDIGTPATSPTKISCTTDVTVNN